MNFADFFEAATSHAPYDYPCRLACGEREPKESEPAWLARGTPCASRLINLPTGLGKTAAVVLAWLWKRVELKKADWPRRLHSAIGYVCPLGRLEGRHVQIFADRDRKLETARQKRQANRLAATQNQKNMQPESNIC